MSDPGAPCEVQVLVPRLGGGDVLVRAESIGRPALPMVRLPGEAGERPGSIVSGIRSSTGFDGLLGIQAVEVGWTTTCPAALVLAPDVTGSESGGASGGELAVSR